LYPWMFCIYGRFVERTFCQEGRYVEGRFVDGCFMEGRFVEGRFVLVPYSSLGTRDSTLYVFITGESRLPGVFTTMESRLAGISITGESFYRFSGAYNNLYKVYHSKTQL
jgi:hypothetical protein